MEIKRFLKRFIFSILAAGGIYLLLKSGVQFYARSPWLRGSSFYMLNFLNLIFIYLCVLVIKKNRGLVRAAFVFFMLSEIFKTISDTSFDLYLINYHIVIQEIIQIGLGIFDLTGFLMIFLACLRIGSGKKLFFSILPVIGMACAALLFLAFSYHWYYSIGALNMLGVLATHGSLIMLIIIVLVLSCTKDSNLILFYVGRLLVFGSVFFLKWNSAEKFYVTLPHFMYFLFLGKICSVIGLMYFAKSKSLPTQWFYSLQSIRSQVVLWSIGAVVALFFILSSGYADVNSTNFLAINIPIFNFFLIPLSLTMMFVADYLTRPLQDLLSWIDLTVESKMKDVKKPIFSAEILEFSVLKKHLLSAFNQIQKQVQQEKLLFEIAAKTVHDVRSPLLVLSMMKDSVNPHLTQEKRELFGNSIFRIQSITQELLTQYRSVKDGRMIQVVQRQPEWITLLLMMAISEKRIQYPNVEFLLDIDSKSWMARAAVTSVDYLRIVSNLLDNAVEASSCVGKVICRLHRANADQYWEIEIADQGVGMSPGQVKKALEGTLTTSKKQGSGIGLSAAIDKIKSWDGSCSIESQLNQGTVIHIFLPILQNPACYIDKISLPSAARVVIYDDQALYHDQWEKRFGELKAWSSIERVHCYHDEEFEVALTQDSKNTVYFIDYSIGNAIHNGIEIIIAHHLQSRAFLITNHYDDASVIEECVHHHIRLLPKAFIGFVEVIV